MIITCSQLNQLIKLMRRQRRGLKNQSNRKILPPIQPAQLPSNHGRIILNRRNPYLRNISERTQVKTQKSVEISKLNNPQGNLKNESQRNYRIKSISKQTIRQMVNSKMQQKKEQIIQQVEVKPIEQNKKQKKESANNRDERISNLMSQLTQQNLIRHNLELALDQYKSYHNFSNEEIVNLFRNAERIMKMGGVKTKLQLNDLLKKQNKTIDEEIRVVNSALYFSKRFYLKLTQIIALLIFLKEKKILLQILTGEGKTVTIACLAAIMTLRGLNVEISTTSPVLGKRDVEELKEFYEEMNIKAGHNFEDAKQPKDCYDKGTIAYGNPHSYEKDILADPYNTIKVRKDRPFDVLIIDEVDSMFIDSNAYRTQLTQTFIGHRQFIYFMKIIWSKVHTYPIIKVWSDYYFLVPHQKQNEEYCIAQVKFQNMTSAIYRQIKEKFGNNVVSIERKEYFLSTIHKWAASAFRAAFLRKEYVDYVVMDGKIVIIDNQNTGVFQHRMTWTDGQHQFLELKHGLKVNIQALISKFMSNITYYDKFPTMYGLTGTLGSDASKNFLRDIYQVKMMQIPPQKTRKLKINEGLIYKTQIEWISGTLKCIKDKVLQKRAVLVIFQDIWNLEMIFKCIEADKNINLKDIFTVKTDQNVSDFRLDCGQVVLATNLAGRGTDFKLSKSLEQRGGLHVIVAFFPKNNRVEMQARGRAGRNGAEGSSEMQMCYQKIRMSVSDKLMLQSQFYKNQSQFVSSIVIEYLTIYQILQEQQLLDSSKNVAKNLRLIDKYYTKYLQLAKRTKLIIKSDTIINGMEQKWAFFLNNLLDRKDIDDNIQIETNKQFMNIFQNTIDNPYQVVSPTHLIYLFFQKYSKLREQFIQQGLAILQVLKKKQLNSLQKFHLHLAEIILLMQTQDHSNFGNIIKDLQFALKERLTFIQSFSIAEIAICIDQIANYNEKLVELNMRSFKDKLQKIDKKMAQNFSISESIKIGKTRKNMSDVISTNIAQIKFYRMLLNHFDFIQREYLKGSKVNSLLYQSFNVKILSFFMDGGDNAQNNIIIDKVFIDYGVRMFVFLKQGIFNQTSNRNSWENESIIAYAIASSVITRNLINYGTQAVYKTIFTEIKQNMGQVFTSKQLKQIYEEKQEVVQNAITIASCGLKEIIRIYGKVMVYGVHLIELIQSKEMIKQYFYNQTEGFNSKVISIEFAGINYQLKYLKKQKLMEDLKYRIKNQQSNVKKLLASEKYKQMDVKSFIDKMMQKFQKEAFQDPQCQPFYDIYSKTILNLLRHPLFDFHVSRVPILDDFLKMIKDCKQNKKPLDSIVNKISFKTFISEQLKQIRSDIQANSKSRIKKICQGVIYKFQQQLSSQYSEYKWEQVLLVKASQLQECFYEDIRVNEYALEQGDFQDYIKDLVREEQAKNRFKFAIMLADEFRAKYCPILQEMIKKEYEQVQPVDWSILKEMIQI